MMGRGEGQTSCNPCLLSSTAAAPPNDATPLMAPEE
jgi:hypothetical protein